MKKVLSLFVMSHWLLASPALAISTDTELIDAICNLTTSKIFSIFELLSRWLLIFGLIVAVIFIGLAAHRLVTSAGDANRISTGKRMLMWAIVGLVIIILARVLVVAVGKFVGVDIPLTGGPLDTAPPPNCS